MNVTRLRWWCAVKTSQNWNLRCGAQTDEINPAIKTCPTVDLSLITSGGEIWRESGPFSHDDWLVVMTMFAPDLAPLTLSPGNALDNFLNLTDELTWHRPQHNKDWNRSKTKHILLIFTFKPIEKISSDKDKNPKYHLKELGVFCNEE